MTTTDHPSLAARLVRSISRAMGLPVAVRPPEVPAPAPVRSVRPPSAQRALDRRLVFALAGRYPKKIQAALAAGANPNCLIVAVAPALHASLGDSLVTYAVRIGAFPLVVQLVRAGATLDRAGDATHRPLQAALAHTDPAIACWLVEAGADPRPTDAHGQNALQRATLAGQIKQVHVIRRLHPQITVSAGDRPAQSPTR